MRKQTNGAPRLLATYKHSTEQICIDNVTAGTRVHAPDDVLVHAAVAIVPGKLPGIVFSYYLGTGYNHFYHF